jgi:hypothetical protein
MLLGSDALGRLSLGQLPGNNAQAVGVTLDIAATLIAGVATGETVPVRFVGGSALTRSRTSAQGATLTVSTTIMPGKAQVGHEITINEADGTPLIVVIFGATDEELRDDAFIHAVVYDDWDLWLLKRREAA